MWSRSPRALVRAVLTTALLTTALLAPPTPGTASPGSGVPALEGERAVRLERALRPDRLERWSTADALVPVTVGPDDDVEISLDTRLYVPQGANERDPRPAILMTHGFGLTKTSNEVVSTARFLAAHGYHVLTYTSSGFGDSGGCITLQSADWDVKGAMQLVDALLEPRNDVLRDRRGLVLGTIGGSYGGGIQLPLAAADRRVRAVIPGRTWNSLRYSLDPNNLVTGERGLLDHDANEQGVFKQAWTSLFFASGTSGAPQGAGGCAEAKLASGDPEEIASSAACAAFYLEVCRVYGLLSTTGDSDQAARDLIARSSASTFLDRVDAATLLVQGQSDTLFNLNDAAATYTALRRRGVPVAMTWNSGGHGGYTSQPGECEAYDGTLRSVREMDRCYLPRRQLQWFDHWLRGEGGPGPGFTWYEDWREVLSGTASAAGRYGTARRFPLPGRRVLHLSADSRLAVRPADARDGGLSFLNPPGGVPAAYSETSNFSGPDASPNLALEPNEEDQQHVVFTSPPLRRAYDAVGLPSLRLDLDHVNGQDLVLHVKVYDVAPVPFVRTLVRRLVTPVRIPAERVGEPVRIRLAGFAHRFQEGHSLALVLAATDATSYNAKVADVITVGTGPDDTLTLPGRPRFGPPSVVLTSFG